jgi:NAD(P) transhydrogenase subunit alpha
MIVGIVKESFPNEARVAMVPALVPQLAKAGIEVVIESGAGDAAGFLDSEYTAKGAKVVSGRTEVFQTADLIAQVRALGANPEQGKADLEFIRDGQAIVGMCEPLTEHGANKALAEKGAVLSRWR